LISTAEFELARSARSDLERAQDLLLHPTLDSLLEACPILEQSAAYLSDLERMVREPGETKPGARENLRRELRDLRDVLSRVERLMSNAAAFHSGWASRVGAGVTDYTRTEVLVTQPVDLRTVAIRA
jgi:hypothetical protein